MIRISVESDQEQWAIGTALVNGVLGFGNWPFEVRRLRSAGLSGSAGAAVHVGGGTTIGGGGASGTASHAGVTGTAGGNAGTPGSGGGGLSVVVPDYRWSLGIPLRTCCATSPRATHREGCDEGG